MLVNAPLRAERLNHVGRLGQSTSREDQVNLPRGYSMVETTREGGDIAVKHAGFAQWAKMSGRYHGDEFTLKTRLIAP